ncbi:major facilitator superfamily domain-containing protein [Xylaria nigripes]|nr:major facilitator superfamily domain-containing protein [Xylaria nigripes]
MHEKSSASSEGHSDPDSKVSPSSSHQNIDVIQVAAHNETAVPAHNVPSKERDSIPKVSGDLRRTASNVLARVVSRISSQYEPAPPPPDGGLTAWTQVAVCFFVLFSAWGYANSFGAFQEYYTETLPQSASAISWIGGIQVFLTLTMGALSGRFLDAGYFISTFLVGVFFQILGIFLMSISTKYWQLLLTQGVISGFGAGIYFTPAISLINTYFDKHRALAIGLTTTGNSLGGAIFPLLVRTLIPRLGFAWTTRVIGFLVLGLLSIAAAFLRTRLPPRKSGPILELRAFKDPKYAGFLFSSFFLYWANYYTFYYIGSFGTQVLGVSYSTASILVIIINAVGFPFRIVVPMVADRIGNINVIVVVASIYAIVSFAWLAVHNVAGYYAFTVIYGATSASYQCLFPSTVARISPELENIGARLGMAFSITAIASLTGPPLGGAIQATSGGFRGPQIWAATVTTLSFVLFSILRLHMGGLNLKAKV